MKAVDWSGIFKKYKGKWVAVLDDQKTVVASGDTAKEAWERAQKKGYKQPVLSQVPKKLRPFIGLKYEYKI